MDTNPFITGFEGIPTAELIRLHNMLSGGYWLKEVRRALNFRIAWEAETIRKGVGAFSYGMISGKRG